MLDLPFDPLKRAKEVEDVVMEGLARKYETFGPEGIRKINLFSLHYFIVSPRQIISQ